MLKKAFAIKAPSPTIAGRSSRLCQSQELVESNSEKKVSNTLARSSNLYGTSVEYTQQSRLQPVGMMREGNFSKYGYQFEVQNYASNNSKTVSGRYPQMQRSNESSGEKSNTSLYKIQLKKVHSRYISYSLGRAVTLTDYKLVKGQTFPNTETINRYTRDGLQQSLGSQRQFVQDQDTVNMGSFYNKNQPIPSIVALERYKDARAQGHGARGLNNYNDYNRLFSQKVTTSLNHKTAEGFNSRVSGQQQTLQRSTAFNSRMSETRNVPELTPVLYPHRGSVPTEKISSGYNPLTSVTETALQSKEYDLNQLPSNHYDSYPKHYNQLHHMNRTEIGKFQHYSYSSKENTDMLATTHPTFNSTSMINNSEQSKEQSYSLSFHKEGNNRISIGNSEASKPSTSLARRKQQANTAQNQYDNPNMSNEKLNQYAMERALRTAYKGTKFQPKRLVNQHQSLNATNNRNYVEKFYPYNQWETYNTEFPLQEMAKPPDFRITSTIPKTYQYFVATVNSGSSGQAPSKTYPDFDSVDYDLDYEKKATSNSSFFYGNQNQLVPLHQQNPESRRAYLYSLKQSAQTKKSKESKETMMKMISQLEFGDKSESFRSAAKQFYVQNVLNQGEYSSPKKSQIKKGITFGHANKKDGSKFLTQYSQNLLDAKRNSGTIQGHQSYDQTSSRHPYKKGRYLITNATATDAYVLQLYKYLWQQFQLLRILKQNRQQQGKGNTKEDSSGRVLPSQALEYGFELTEEQMYQRLFGSQGAAIADMPYASGHRPPDKGKYKAKNAPYASFDCPECIQMANMMLEEELKFYMSKNQFKKGTGTKARSNSKQSKSQHKGIAGLQTHGQGITTQFGVYSLINGQTQSFDCVNGINVYYLVQKSLNSMNQKRTRSHTYQGPGSAKKGAQALGQGSTDPHTFGTIYVNRVTPQIFFKKQVNQSFKYIIKGEQVNPSLNEAAYKTLIKYSYSCTCGAFAAAYQIFNLNSTFSGLQALLFKGAKNCSCIQGQDDNFNFTNATAKGDPHKDKRTSTPGKGGRNDEKKLKAEKEGANGLNESTNKWPAVEPRDVLDGTSKYKKITKQAKIYRPNVPFHTHLKNSPINQTIQNVNEVVLTLFKAKIKSSDQNIIKLLRYFYIPIPRGNGVVLDTNVLKQPDFHHVVNYKLLYKLYQVLNKENNNIKPESSSSIFRFYVGKGNNYPSVRQIVSRRSWWNRVTQKQEKFYGQTNMYHYNECDASISQSSDDAQLTNKQFKFSSGCHFIWTQWRKTEHHQFLKKVAKDRDKCHYRDTQDLKPQDKENPAYLQYLPILIYNRLDDNYHLSNKKALFRNISNYYYSIGVDPFEVAIPLTFNVKTPSSSDTGYAKFIKAYKDLELKKDQNIWIIKPGENSNRGTGIQVANSINEVRYIVHSMASNAGGRTSIVQKYIDRPLLIHGRKFDIRGYAMMTSINGALKGYMYRDCYFRTSSKQFDLNNLHSKYIHLTNDAIQVQSEDYGKFESGNKLSINDFQRYLDYNHGQRNVHFMRDLFPYMERLVTDSFRSVGSKIDPSRVQNCFEIFGYDFMIDANFKVYLIEANTNPCLEICSPLLARIIPELLDNSFRIAIDPLYQPIYFMASLRAEIDAIHPTSPNVDKMEQQQTAPATTTGTLDPSHEKQTDKFNEKSMSPKKIAFKKPSEQTINNGYEPSKDKRQRLELLTQIKYTLIYDERVDQAAIDEALRKYEQTQEPLDNQRQEKIIDAISGEVIEAEPTDKPLGDDLMREVQEEEKLDEQAAKKEEIEAADDEDRGVYFGHVKPLISIRESEDDDGDDEEGTDEDFYN